MNITWYNEKPKDCVVTLASGNITLNKPASLYFENAYSVMLGIEKEKKLIIIKPLSKADAQRHDIPDKSKYKITVRASYSRVTNKAFMEKVSEFAGIDFEKGTHKFKSDWDQSHQVLIVDLKEAF